jgi:hypothetical protein
MGSPTAQGKIAADARSTDRPDRLDGDPRSQLRTCDTATTNSATKLATSVYVSRAAFDELTATI